MNNNTITVNGVDYEILFVYRDHADSLLMLLTDGTDMFCVVYEQNGDEISLLPCTDEQLEETVAEYNRHVQDLIEWNGVLYERVADISGICLAAKEGDTRVLYAFTPEDGSWKPLQLDAAGKLFYKNMYRARLEENHDFLQSAVPITARADRATAQNRLCSLGDYGVYLLHDSDSVPSLLFVSEKTGRPVVSGAEQQELLGQFREWENQEYARASDFVLENADS